MKKVLIIGAAGFVGPYLIDNLRKHHYIVIPTKLSSQRTKDKSFINLNILDKKEIIKVLNQHKPDYIVHLAAQASVFLSWENPNLTFNINVIGALNLFDSIKQSNIKCKTLLIGTSEEYGSVKKIPIKENDQCEPNNFYALSKITQEKIGKIYFNAYKLNVIFVRAFNHIGPGQSLGFVVPDFCSQIINIEKNKSSSIIKVGNLSSKRDFTDVRDIVNAYRLLLEKGKGGEIYNVGSGKSISINDILKMLLSFSKKKIKIVIDKSKFRPIETKEVKANISKLVKDTGYKSKYDIKNTLKETLEYYRNL